MPSFFKILSASELPSKFGISPFIRLYPFQERAIETMSRHYKHILCDEMGLGKTIQAIGVLHEIQKDQNPYNQPHLIVVPTIALIDQWKSELLDKSTWVQGAQICLLKTIDDVQAVHGRQKTDPEFLNGKICITTYDLVKTLNLR